MPLDTLEYIHFVRFPLASPFFHLARSINFPRVRARLRLNEKHGNSGGLSLSDQRAFAET